MDPKSIKVHLNPQAAMTPYKLSILMKEADKIITRCANIPQWLISFDEMEFLLEMVLDAVRKAKEVNENAPLGKD